MDFSAAAEDQPQVQELTVPELTYDLAPIKTGLAQYDQGITKMETETKGLSVSDKASESRAIEIAGGAKTIAKNLKRSQENLTGPANDYVKAVRNLFRSYLDRLGAIEDNLKQKASAFAVQQRLEQQKRDAEAREEARKLQEKIEAEARAQREEAARKAREAAEALKKEKEEAARALLQKIIEEESAAAVQETPVIVVPVVAPQPTVTRTETGSGHVRMEWTFEVIDASQVPRKYLIVDEKAIRADIRAGIRQIPGVNIYEKPVMSIRT